MGALAGKTVVLGVTGGISAYKSAELCRLLRKADAEVRVVMTRAATEFITPLTLQTLSGNPVSQQLFDPAEEAEIGHIRLADDADVVVVAPATADAIARFAAGRAADLLSAVVLATKAPVVLAPAMNVNMWENPLTQGNLARVLASGQMTTVGPDAGELACGWIGAGRLVDPAEIVAAVEVRLASAAVLAGRRIVVTAGPTHEPLDDVRFLGNRSSGKMGFAIAEAAARLGAEVSLIAGPVSLPTPAGVQRRTDVSTALDMRDVLAREVTAADMVVMTAAVGDFRAAAPAAGKMSRRDGGGAPVNVALIANPDLLAELGAGRGGDRPVLVGFAAELEPDPVRLADRARAKLTEKGCDVIIANDVATPGMGFGGDRNAVTLVFRDGRAVSLPVTTKRALAEQIMRALAPLLATFDSSATRRHLRVT